MIIIILDFDTYLKEEKENPSSNSSKLQEVIRQIKKLKKYLSTAKNNAKKLENFDIQDKVKTIAEIYKLFYILEL